jgi:hypothetical protein
VWYTYILYPTLTGGSLTIQECIYAGKPFKTVKMNDYIYAGTDGYFHWYGDDDKVIHFPVGLVLSNEWYTILPENVIPFQKPNK